MKMLRVKTCSECGKTFEAKRKDARICGPSCHVKASRRRKRIRERPVESVVRGDNGDLIREVCKLYVRPDDRIADLTWGKGSFWRKVPALRDAQVTGSDLLTVPERPWDFTDTPYEPRSFDIAVIDPPYQPNGRTSVISDQYQLHTVGSMDEVRRFYRDGMTEAVRIARRQIWVKCMDMVHNGKQHPMMTTAVWQGMFLGLHLRDTFILIATARAAPPARWNVQHHAQATQLPAGV